MRLVVQRNGLRRVAGFLTVLAGLTGGLPASAGAEDGEAAPARRSFRGPAGLQIDVTAGGAAVGDREALAALEEAARQLRARLDATPPESLAPPADSALPAPPADVAQPPPCLPEPTLPPPGEWVDFLGVEGCDLTLFPATRLWDPPLANLLAPRMYVMPNTVREVRRGATLDAAFGGDLGWLRLHPEGRPDDGVQIDVFAAAFTRLTEFRTLTDVDYRFGVPVTFADGPWSGKVGYEHTSSHLGDDVIEQNGLRKRGRIRDEIVSGLAFRAFDALRLYGEVGYAAFTLSTPGPHRRDRYDFGCEWRRRRPTGFCGQPYAAVDLSLFGDEDYTPDLSVQAGWEWVADCPRLSSWRLGVEYYDGRSPFGQFFQRHEQYVGFGLFFDF
jgi:hypothetical protein